MPARAVITRLRREMALAADPKKAVGMQAYMKSTMPYYGLNLLAVRRVSRQVFGDMEMGCLEWREKLLALRRGAPPPAKRYAGQVFLMNKRHPDFVRPGVMAMLEEIVVTRPRAGSVSG